MSADGTLEIKFSRYENKEGTLESGSKCDRLWGTLTCDHYFTVCLGHKTDGINRCDIGEYETQTFLNQNVIRFQGNDQYHKTFKFIKWQVRKCNQIL